MKYPKNIWLMGFVFIVSLQDCKAGHDVLGIGHALYDILVECKSDDELLEYTQGIEVKKGDCQIIESSTAQALKRKIKSLAKEQAGGATSNVIAGIASLGGDVGIITALADDSHGKSFDKDMKALGVKRFNSIIEGQTTGVVYSLITPDGERTMLTSTGVCSMINPEDASPKRIKKYTILLSEGYMYYAKNCIDLLKDAFAIAHENNVKTVFTLSSPCVVETFRTQFFDLLPNVDILVGNEKEFCLFCECDSVQDVYAAIQNKVAMAVITRGPEGAVIVTKDEILSVPVIEKVEKPIDTTGAGDIFLAGFLYGQTHYMSLEQSAELGNALAGKLIQQIGARADFDTKEVLAHCVTS